jgi:hypothetical protein
MARKKIRVMSGADYTWFARGGAVTYPVPYAITLGTSKGVQELDIFKAPLANMYDETVGENTHVTTIRSGGKAKCLKTGNSDLYDCEVVSMTARKVTLRPLSIINSSDHYRLNKEGLLVEDMDDFCAANTI